MEAWAFLPLQFEGLRIEGPMLRGMWRDRSSCYAVGFCSASPWFLRSLGRSQHDGAFASSFSNFNKAIGHCVGIHVLSLALLSQL